MQRKLLLSCGLMPFLIETGIFRVCASLLIGSAGSDRFGALIA
jgi:hypothetical protein